MSYRILMAPAAWDLFWTYTNLVPGEVGAFGYAEHYPVEQEIYVSEVFLVPQESSAAQVDFVENGLPFAIEKAITDDKLDQLRFCIHSHGAFAPPFSATDEDMIRKIGRTADWFVSAIFNRKGERNARIDQFLQTPFGRVQTKHHDIPIEMYSDPTYEELCIAELEKYVAKPKPAGAKNWKPSAEGTGPNAKHRPAGQRQLPVGSESANADSAEMLTWDELADECGWETFDADGIRYYLDPEDEYKCLHMEPVFDDDETRLLIAAAIAAAERDKEALTS